MFSKYARFIDYHVHTNAKGSDGFLRPREVIQHFLSTANGLGYHASDLELSITDHNSSQGLGEASTVCKQEGISFLPGVELRVRYSAHPLRQDYEILLYGEGVYSGEIAGVISEIEKGMRIRIQNQIDMWTTRGVNLANGDYSRLTQDEADSLYNDQNYNDVMVFKDIFQMHVEKACLDLTKTDLVNLFYSNFRRKNGATYLPYDNNFPEAEDLLRTAHDVECKAILAHPTFYCVDTIALAEDMLLMDIDGFEVFCRSNSRHDAFILSEMCQTHGLIATAGTDFHNICNEYRIGLEMKDMNR